MSEDKIEYTTPFRYGYKFDLRLAERDSKSGKYIIHHKGEVKTVRPNGIVWSEKERITRAQFDEIVKGTKGIIEDSIKGDFEFDKTEKMNDQRSEKISECKIDNTRYYVPKIEEFYLGFEYAVFYNNTDVEHYGTWISEEFRKVLTGDKRTGDLELLIKNKKVRVKYLDRKDIENLGFKHIGNAVDIWYELEGRFDIGNWTSYKIQMHYGRTDHRMFINAIDFGDEHKIFEGYVRNKSELKKLLKQLNIE